MKVAQLSRLLDNLVQGLDGIVAAPVLSDLQSFARVMEPFRDATVVEFTKFLGEFGQVFKETGKITPQGKIALPKTPKAPKLGRAQLVANALASIRALLKAIDSQSVDNSRVDQVMDEITKLTVPDLHEVLGELQIVEKPRAKVNNRREDQRSNLSADGSISQTRLGWRDGIHGEGFVG
jgi:hypothetical protein